MPPRPVTAGLSRRCLLGAAAGAALLGVAGCSSDGGGSGGSGPGADGSGSGDGPDDASVRRYGTGDSRYGRLLLPPVDGGSTAEAGPGAGGGSAAIGSIPVVVLVHGGFWRSEYGLDLMEDLAADVVARGWAAWNVEYRRVGEDGGGWPGTFDDVAAALDHLAVLAEGEDRALDLSRVAVVGHSAGGHLGAWLAARPGLPASAPGAAPTVVPMAVVSQAGVLDLVACAETGTGGSSAPDLMGGTPAEVPERYALGSPLARLPLGVPVRCVHGTADANVPIAQSEDYVAAATAAGDEGELVPFDGDHFAVLDPTHESWTGSADWLGERFSR